MSQQDKVLYQIIESLENQWDQLEGFLLMPSQQPEFLAYLSNYCGLAKGYSLNNSYQKGGADVCATGVLDFFVGLFSTNGLFSLSSVEIERVLEEVEKTINLALYYWFGLNDRNFQFRTWVHFFNLEGFEQVFLTKEGQAFAFRLCEQGMGFGRPGSKLPLQIRPISSVFVSTQEIFTELNAMSKLRAIQREICLLIDEWEYQNSILATEYSLSLQIMHANPSNEDEDYHEKLLKKMDEKRNFLAAFGLHAFCEFQEWVNQRCVPCTDADILSEADALCALILSALQKFFLPASISRLVYGKNILHLVERFAQARLVYNCEDYSTRLMLQSAQSALGKAFEERLFSILKAKPFEWKLCFDPCAALKAFCFSYSRQHHILLCTLMTFCYIKKCPENRLEDYQLSELLSAFGMQEIFWAHLGLQGEGSGMYATPEAVDGFARRALKEVCVEYFTTHLKTSQAHLEWVKTIQPYLEIL